VSHRGRGHEVECKAQRHEDERVPNHQVPARRVGGEGYAGECGGAKPFENGQVPHPQVPPLALDECAQADSSTQGQGRPAPTWQAGRHAQAVRPGSHHPMSTALIPMQECPGPVAPPPEEQHRQRPMESKRLTRSAHSGQGNNYGRDMQCKYVEHLSTQQRISDVAQAIRIFGPLAAGLAAHGNNAFHLLALRAVAWQTNGAINMPKVFIWGPSACRSRHNPFLSSTRHNPLRGHVCMCVRVCAHNLRTPNAESSSLLSAPDGVQHLDPAHHIRERGAHGVVRFLAGDRTSCKGTMQCSAQKSTRPHAHNPALLCGCGSSAHKMWRVCCVCRAGVACLW